MGKKIYNVPIEEYRNFLKNATIKKEGLAMALRLFKDESNPWYQLINAIYKKLWEGEDTEFINEDVKLVYDIIEPEMLSFAENYLQKTATLKNSPLYNHLRKQDYQKSVSDEKPISAFTESPKSKKLDLSLISDEQKDYDYLNTHFKWKETNQKYASAFYFVNSPEFEPHHEHIKDVNHVVEWFEGKTA